MKSIYIIGSLRNRQKIIDLGTRLRNYDYDVFDSWIAAGPEADDFWQDYANERGLSYREALNDYSARHVFEFDKHHLDRCDIAVLCLPAGKSAHIEMGYMVGRGKPVYVLFDQVPDRYDVMYNFATDVCFSEEELFDTLRAFQE